MYKFNHPEIMAYHLGNTEAYHSSLDCRAQVKLNLQREKALHLQILWLLLFLVIFWMAKWISWVHIFSPSMKIVMMLLKYYTSWAKNTPEDMLLNHEMNLRTRSLSSQSFLFRKKCKLEGLCNTLWWWEAWCHNKFIYLIWEELKKMSLWRFYACEARAMLYYIMINDISWFFAKNWKFPCHHFLSYCEGICGWPRLGSNCSMASVLVQTRQSKCIGEPKHAISS